MTNRIIVHVWKNLFLPLFEIGLWCAYARAHCTLAWIEFNSSHTLMYLLLFWFSWAQFVDIRCVNANYLNRTHRPHRYVYPLTGTFAAIHTHISTEPIDVYARVCLCVYMIDNGFNCHRQSSEKRMNERTATIGKITAATTPPSPLPIV